MNHALTDDYIICIQVQNPVYKNPVYLLFHLFQNNQNSEYQLILTAQRKTNSNSTVT